MSLTAPRAWLVAYDIAEPRRLVRLHRFIRKRAVPVQYSVFFFQGSATQLGRLVKEIEQRIELKADDVRVYQLPERLDCVVMGRGSLPDGSLFSPQGPALAVLTGPADD